MGVMDSIYCKCKNNYCVRHLCDCDDVPEYWKQGIGKTQSTENET